MRDLGDKRCFARPRHARYIQTARLLAVNVRRQKIRNRLLLCDDQLLLKQQINLWPNLPLFVTFGDAIRG